MLWTIYGESKAFHSKAAKNRKLGDGHLGAFGWHFISGDIWAFRETTEHGAWSQVPRTPSQSAAWSSGRSKWGHFALGMMLAFSSGPALRRAKKREAWGGEQCNCAKTLENPEHHKLGCRKDCEARGYTFCFQCIHDAVYAFVFWEIFQKYCVILMTTVNMTDGGNQSGSQVNPLTQRR